MQKKSLKIVGKVQENLNYSISSEENSDVMKQNVFYRIVNYERNREALKSKPYLPVWDLAVTFHCLIKDNDSHIYSIQLTDEHLRHWRINVKTITRWAVENTPRLFPVKINTMEEAIGGALEGSPAGGQSIYVITNDTGINGASCILYQNAVKYLADTLEVNLFILPSSIHEVIVLPDNGRVDKNALAKMVSEVNSTQVSEEDYLSDSIYYYNRNDEKILRIS